MARIRDGFDIPTARTPSRVRLVELRLQISEDDTGAVEAIAAVPEVLNEDGSVLISAVPAVAAVPARINISYNDSYRFEILDQDGEVLEVRSGTLDPNITTARRGQIKGLLDNLMAQAKGSVK